MNETLVIEIFTDRDKKILTTNEPRAAIEKKLKKSLLAGELANYNVYTLETFLKFNKSPKI